jgi:hypothetical protein
VALAVLPARSVAVQVTERSPAAEVSGVSQSDEARPDVASAAFAVAVITPPASTLDGEAVGASVGGVASRVIVTERVLLPPRLLAEHVKVTPLVSAVTEVALQPVLEVMSLSASVTVQLTPTSLVYHPLLPRVPVTFGVITGPVVSTGSPTSVEPEMVMGTNTPSSFVTTTPESTPKPQAPGPVVVMIRRLASAGSATARQGPETLYW